MKNRITGIVLSALLILGTVGCGGTKDEQKKTSESPAKSENVVPVKSDEVLKLLPDVFSDSYYKYSVGVNMGMWNMGSFIGAGTSFEIVDEIKGNSSDKNNRCFVYILPFVEDGAVAKPAKNEDILDTLLKQKDGATKLFSGMIAKNVSAEAKLSIEKKQNTKIGKTDMFQYDGQVTSSGKSAKVRGYSFMWNGTPMALVGVDYSTNSGNVEVVKKYVDSMIITFQNYDGGDVPFVSSNEKLKDTLAFLDDSFYVDGKVDDVYKGFRLSRPMQQFKYSEIKYGIYSKIETTPLLDIDLKTLTLDNIFEKCKPALLKKFKYADSVKVDVATTEKVKLKDFEAVRVKGSITDDSKTYKSSLFVAYLFMIDGVPGYLMYNRAGLMSVFVEKGLYSTDIQGQRLIDYMSHSMTIHKK